MKKLGITVQEKAVVENFSIEHVVPFFQPIFDLKNQKVIRYECLSRLISADDIMCLPAQFLSIVDSSHSNTRLIQRMLEMSSAYCMPRRMRWSIHMLKANLNDTVFVEWMQNLLCQLDTNLVGIELAYGSVRDCPHILKSLIEDLPHIHVTIDDVYKFEDSLIDVISTGIHALKIHGNMIDHFSNTDEEKTLIEIMLNHCKTTGCDVIAGNIEDDNTLDAVEKLGILYGQGYFLSQTQRQVSNLKQL
jgi:EAL domain-containing protein (putative c-di-GMP-specific phosphodiesterase class I)